MRIRVHSAFMTTPAAAFMTTLKPHDQGKCPFPERALDHCATGSRLSSNNPCRRSPNLLNRQKRHVPYKGDVSFQLRWVGLMQTHWDLSRKKDAHSHVGGVMLPTRVLQNFPAGSNFTGRALAAGETREIEGLNLRHAMLLHHRMVGVATPWMCIRRPLTATGAKNAWATNREHSGKRGDATALSASMH
jgi:hypothetical protein